MAFIFLFVTLPQKQYFVTRLKFQFHKFRTNNEQRTNSKCKVE